MIAVIETIDNKVQGVHLHADREKATKAAEELCDELQLDPVHAISDLRARGFYEECGYRITISTTD